MRKGEKRELRDSDCRAAGSLRLDERVEWKVREFKRYRVEVIAIEQASRQAKDRQKTGNV